jgi:glycerol-3-phosphate O-acyltransferase/dihydroxyacetone phosphate acyltransferase
MKGVFDYNTHGWLQTSQKIYSGKQLMAAWRILVGVWAPKRWDMSLAALTPYTTPATPKENPWIDKPRRSGKNTPTSSAPPSDTEEPPVKGRPKRRPPSRRLVRHVLRARIEAVKSLTSFFDYLQNAPSGTSLPASTHLAKLYGSVKQTGVEEVTGWPEYEGERSVHEIVTFLKQRGAKIPAIRHASKEAAEWAAALTSGPEGEGTETADEA